MKNLTYPPILTICVIVLISPLFFSLESVNLAKPTFKERVLEQVKAGKKIAVFTVLSPIGYEHTSGKKSKLCDEVANGSIIDKSSSAGSKYIYSAVFAGELVPVDYEDINPIVAKELNKGLGVDIFEAVNSSDVPKKMVKMGRADIEVEDWWSTDYDLIVQISMNATYETEGEDAFTSSLNMKMLLDVREVIQGQESLDFVTKGKAVGSVNTEGRGHNACVKTLFDLKIVVAQPNSLVVKCKETIVPELADFIKKENKKYDKASKKKKKT